MYYCHCGTCRKASGSSFATNVAVRTEDLVIVAGREALAAFESGDPGMHPAAHGQVASKTPWFEVADGLPQAPGNFA
jgi:hypothetical protein